MLSYYIINIFIIYFNMSIVTSVRMLLNFLEIFVYFKTFFSNFDTTVQY